MLKKLLNAICLAVFSKKYASVYKACLITFQ